MSAEIETTFLSRYLRSLREETRQENDGKKYGFDHVILKLAEAESLIPLRIAFHRESDDDLPKPKKEPEHGEDLKVISKDGKQLTVFVLKGVKLTYRNWTACKFDQDLSRAWNQDLSMPELAQVEEVKIVLVYNKDDESKGVEAFERMVSALPKTIANRAHLVFERWNLTELTNRVNDRLISSPALLPENFFRSFSYICWQVGDFSHGSEQWEEVLIPDWREFLQAVLSEKVGEREIMLVSVALLIVRAHGKDEPAWETGWIELVEWAVIAVWRAANLSEDPRRGSAAYEIWLRFYLVSLEEYYEKNHSFLAVEDSLSIGSHDSFSEAIGSFYAFWHLGRLGVLALGFGEMLGWAEEKENPDSGYVETIRNGYIKVLDWIIELLNANPATKRPLLDIHHIQLFLIWRVFKFAGREDEVFRVLIHVHELLALRRRNNGGFRLIDQSNSWENLLEYIATDAAPSESFGRSSYLLQMLIEILVGYSTEEGDLLAYAYYKHLILGEGDDGESLEFPEEVELMSWVPPEDWVKRVLHGNAGNSGECVPVAYELSQSGDLAEEKQLANGVRKFVAASRQVSPSFLEARVPMSILVLACLRHDSPIPPELWRMAAFPMNGETPGNSKEAREDSVSGKD